MAYTQIIDFQRPLSSHISVDCKPPFFTEDLDRTTAPDESFSNPTMLSPVTDERRESFANSVAGTVYSPQTTFWDDSQSATLPDHQFSARNPFSNNNPFRRDSAFAQPAAQWPPGFDGGIDTRSAAVPTSYDAYSADFESAPAPGFPNTTAFGSLPASAVRPSSVFPTSATPAPMSASPPPGTDWMAHAERSSMDARFPKHMRGHSPSNYPPNYRSGDGIRKKNARFEIPQERNLNNIDHLIEHAQNEGNEDDVKELKQQKRLLRNRQAALDSRQRKKMRAEELEVENKQLKDQMEVLKQTFDNLQLLADTNAQQREQLLQQNVGLQEHARSLELDKENLVIEHTQETSELRKKIQVLQEMVESGTSSDSTRPGSAEYESNDMYGLGVTGLDMDDWDPFSNYVMDLEPAENVSKPNETSLVLAPKKKAEDEKESTASSGLLMMLLLCGAWVASKASTSLPVSIPSIPEEVRSDAAAVFDDLMKDHGVSTFQASGVAGDSAKTQTLSFPMPSSTNGKMDDLHDRLTQPSKQQEREAAFSLTAKQVNDLTCQDYGQDAYGTPPEEDSPVLGNRVRLIDTLRAMREEAKSQSTSNVYTRSLLWERVPAEVVEQFKQMAEDNSRSRPVTAEGDGGGGGD